MAWLGFGYARWDQHIRVRARVGVSTVGVSFVGVSFVGVSASAQNCKASFYVLNMILMKKRHFQVLGT
jgi:hypothetical protein